VVHIKKEQSHESDETRSTFEFEWLLKLAFDPRMETIYPTLNIVDFNWSPNIPDETRANIMDLTYSLVDSEALYR